MANNKLFVIAGPTASGKTQLAIDIAKILNCEVLSADSRQFYKELNIGVARPSLEELQAVPHHFIAHLSIHDTYSVGSFEEDSLTLLDKLFKINPNQVLVGGSGLYIDAVCRGFDALPPANNKIREELLNKFNEEGIEVLQNQLQQLDPVHFSEMDIHNSQRLIRALEVCLSTGRPFSSLRANKLKKRPFEVIYLGIDWEREKLYKRINDRVHQMMAEGLIEEVESLLPYKGLNALQTVGYKEIFQYLAGEQSLSSAVEMIQQNTRRFAKRQMTWFRKYDDMRWLHASKLSDSDYIQSMLTT